MSDCSIEGCSEPIKVKSRGWCNKHYKRWRAYGTPEGRASRTARFWERVNKSAPNGCWEWTGQTNNGYGRLSWGPRMDYAHRIAFRLVNGSIPHAFEIDHICHNTICVNPSHLRLANRSENQQNMRGPNRNTTTGVRGVSYIKSRGVYQCHGSINGKSVGLGYFTTLDAATEFIAEWRRENYPFSDMDKVA
ncbi:HNH endonuclease signature motif containing protein [Micrococcus sp. TA1]|uniref:HNH endonuclease signature motif containing protein n=1 Tax=Micrococcus sp. TA1 TaxID=681627 RepID=UPI001834255E|nr:hypothetical protein [Micrococcus sp. TA1]